MGTVITPQLIDIIDPVSAVRTYSSGTVQRLRTCEIERWGLRVECPTPDDPFHDLEVSWLLPDLNLRLTHQRPRSRHARREPSVLTAVRIYRAGQAWRTTDLLLGLSAMGGRTARIVQCEEFAAAVAGRVLRPGDANLALHTVHKTLEELSHFRHDVGAWLSAKHIFEVWPPF
ncbi:hypothetical protein EV193_11895 [Herbihabitans rhizosphaerae]|uniref:DUF402 domain-containing protein n=1 Tax=Herbihabitans rhizosphaerae TaxID=1872711 RepID=A0A4Q7KDZ3_9PSEU|nr:hypothetical protein [Herbihabitans rhizosphaerae]RZS29839.1 hypothetical protein EV193_11895 [Herbihabitans rhizosphaerae]